MRLDSQSSRAKGSDTDAHDDARLAALGYKREVNVALADTKVMHTFTHLLLLSALHAEHM
jgi:hypothetical protein